MYIPSYLYSGKYSGVYCIEKVTNGVDGVKRYIGSSRDMYQRLHKHNALLRVNKHQNAYLQNAWNKYGEDNYLCYVIEFCSEDSLATKEQEWIDKLDPVYNITKEVIRNILSEESRIKISSTLKEGYKTGRIKPTKTRKINVYNLNAELIGVFNTKTEAAKAFKVGISSINRVLVGAHKQSNGLQFRYFEDATSVEILQRSKYLVPVKLDELSGKP